MHLVSTVSCPLYAPKVGSDQCTVSCALTIFYISNLDMFGFLTNTLTVYQAKWAKTAKWILDVVFLERLLCRKEKQEAGAESGVRVQCLAFSFLVDPFDFSVCVCRTAVQLISYQCCKTWYTFIIALWHPWEVLSKSRAKQTAKLCHPFIVLWLI